MPRRCGCANDQCGCVVVDTPSVTWEGFGTIEEPFTPNQTFPLEVADTSSLDLEISVDDETVLTAYPLGAGINVQTFTENGTWVAPAGASVARILLVGGGGGGQAGDAFNGASAIGGGGGNGGQVTSANLYGPDIPPTANVFIGTGGAGGLGTLLTAGSGYVDGALGTHGTGSAFIGPPDVGGALSLQAGGGRGGGWVPPTITPAGTVAGGPGYHGGDTVEALNRLAPGGGGGGAHIPVGAATVGGFPSPALGRRILTEVQAQVGQPGSDELIALMGGGGGGGNPAVNGGRGGLYGGGGGGGGATNTLGSMSGSGGDGADGYCIVISW